MNIPIRIIGIICISLVLIGLIFRIQHWPFAGEGTILGASLGAIAFIPMVGINNMVSNRKPLNIVTNVVGIFVGFLLLVGALFKIMSWPSNYFLEIGLVGTIFIFAPLYFINLAKTPQPFNLRTVLVLVLFSTLFYGTAKKTTAWWTIESMQNSSHIAESSIIVLEELNTIEAEDSIQQEILDTRRKLTDFIEELRTFLISETLEITLEEAKALKNTDVWEIENVQIASDILIGDPNRPNDHEYSALELRKSLYNHDLLLRKVTGSQTSFFPNHQKFFTDGLEISWEMQMFYNMPFLGILNTLQQLQIEVDVATLKALHSVSLTAPIQATKDSA